MREFTSVNGIPMVEGKLLNWELLLKNYITIWIHNGNKIISFYYDLTKNELILNNDNYSVSFNFAEQLIMEYVKANNSEISPIFKTKKDIRKDKLENLKWQ